MKNIALTVTLLVLAAAFALEGTCDIGLRRLSAPLSSPEATLCIAEGGTAGSPLLPFDITLKRFDIDSSFEKSVFCSTGSENDASRTKFYPKQYSSTLEIDGQECTTAVNHPYRYGHWRIYQYDFDLSEGRSSVLKVVKSAPVGWIATLAFLAAALVFLFFELRSFSRNTFFVAAALTIGISMATLAGLSLKALPPVLRSPFFIPHILMYMVAYALLTISLFSRRSAGSASALLLIGLLLGSIWAKMAWGHFWQWDIKECWAAATFFLSAAASLQAKKGSRTCFLLLAILAFAAMNMTWYGVNWLPNAASSLHVY